MCDIPCDKMEEFYDSIYPPRMTNLETFLNGKHPYLDQPIHLNELLGVLRRLKPGKTPGPEGIFSPFLMNLPEN